MRIRLLDSDELDKLLDTDFGLPQYCAQGAAIEFRMIRDDDLRERTIPPEHDVAVGLALPQEADFLQRTYALAS